MANQAERIPVDDQYLRALGRAAYNFAYLEWGIVWLAECINAGFLNEVRYLTAGQIATRFEEAVVKLRDEHPDRVVLQLLALSFGELVDERNRLMHGNPHTAAGGEQRLLYDGKHGRIDWTAQLIDGFSDQTATASIEASRLLHGGLLDRYKKDDKRR